MSRFFLLHKIYGNIRHIILYAYSVCSRDARSKCTGKAEETKLFQTSELVPLPAPQPVVASLPPPFPLPSRHRPSQKPVERSRRPKARRADAIPVPGKRAHRSTDTERPAFSVYVENRFDQFIWPVFAVWIYYRFRRAVNIVVKIKNKTR